MDIQAAVRKAGLAKIELGPGYVCLLRDGVIRLPDGEDNRDLHQYRTVVVLSNNFLCTSLYCPLVTVAPTSHKLNRRNATEIVVRQSLDNGLTYDSRIMLAHIQPVIKTDIDRKLGELSLADWENLMTQIVKNFDRA
jgi:mRNA-degrading endonuclease toxin of MazEF toxin-antitoxin module